MDVRGDAARGRALCAALLTVILAGCGDTGGQAPPAARPTGGVDAAIVRFVPGHMAFADQSRGWVDGADCAGGAPVVACSPTMMVTDDGGASWRRAASPPLVDDPSCRTPGCASAAKLFFPTSSLGFAYGGTTPYLYRTTDGGLSWNAVDRGGAPPAVVAGPVMDIATVGGGALWMVLRACAPSTAATCRITVQMSLDGGRSWTPAPSTPDAVVDVRSSVRLVTRQSTVWLVSTALAHADTRIATTPDAGRTWTDLSTPCPRDDRYLELLDAADVRTLWLVCGGLGAPGPGPVFVSASGGTRWSQTAAPGVMADARRLVVSSPSTAWLSIINAPLQVSHDSGHTWMTAIPASAIDQVVFSDSNHGWAMEGAERGSDIRLWRTVDGGGQWARVIL